MVQLLMEINRLNRRLSAPKNQVEATFPTRKSVNGGVKATKVHRRGLKPTVLVAEKVVTGLSAGVPWAPIFASASQDVLHIGRGKLTNCKTVSGKREVLSV